MVNVLYTVRGFELQPVNPELSASLEKVVGYLHNVKPTFSGFSRDEEAIELMHGVLKEDGVWPEDPWAKARFRFDPETRIDSLNGFFFSTSEGLEGYVKLAEDVPEVASKVPAIEYDSSMMYKLNQRFVAGKSVDTLVIDSGETYDTVKLNLEDGTELTFFYNPGSFVGFEVGESGKPSTHYILSGADPSIYVPDFLGSYLKGKDVLYNEGLQGGTVKPLLSGTTVSYQDPDQFHPELISADLNDQYFLLFKTENNEDTQSIYRQIEQALKPATENSTYADALEDGIRNLSIVDTPTFATELMDSQNSDPGNYALKITLLSTGSFPYRNDMATLIHGALLAAQPKATNFKLIEMPSQLH